MLATGEREKNFPSLAPHTRWNVIDVKHLPYAVKIRLIHTSINKKRRNEIREKFSRIFRRLLDVINLREAQVKKLSSFAAARSRRKICFVFAL